jgi:hypothetical protein
LCANPVNLQPNRHFIIIQEPEVDEFDDQRPKKVSSRIQDGAVNGEVEQGRHKSAAAKA